MSSRQSAFWKSPARAHYAYFFSKVDFLIEDQMFNIYRLNIA